MYLVVDLTAWSWLRAELAETLSKPACPCLISDFHTRTELLRLLRLPLHHARTGSFRWMVAAAGWAASPLSVQILLFSESWLEAFAAQNTHGYFVVWL